MAPLQLSAGILRVTALTYLLLHSTIPSISGFSSTSLHPRIRTPALASSSSTLLYSAAGSPDTVVISPPGGIGEIASVESALLGGSVRWFVVSAPSSTSESAPAGTPAKVSLTAETLSAIERAGGSIELAGATADSLLINSDDGSSSASAVAAWCRGARSVICTYDGAEDEKRRVDRAKPAEDRGLGNEDKMIQSGIRVAAREAVSVASSGAAKVAVLPAGEEMGESPSAAKKKGGLLDGLFGGSKVSIPETFSEAMGGASIIRHGELFGAPESSVSVDYVHHLELFLEIDRDGQPFCQHLFL